MRRQHRGPVLAGLVVAAWALLSLACSPAQEQMPVTPTAAAGAPATPTQAATPGEPSPTATPETSVLPLESLSPAAARLVEASEVPLGIAVAIPARHELYLDGEQRPFALASAVKVPLLIAELQRIRATGAPADATEREALRSMIVASDNKPASELFERLGGGEGLRRALAPLGGDRFRWPSDQQWGDTAATPADLAGFLSHLVTGEGIAPDDLQVTLALMQAVVPDQRWGASGGLDPENSEVVLAIKNGWYPAPDGWRLDSTGIVEGPGVDYVIVMLSDEQPEFADGVSLFERIAAAVHGALLPPDLVSEVRTPTPSPSPPAEPTAPAATATPTPPPPIAFVKLPDSTVLVPAAGRIVSVDRASDSVTYVFELKESDSATILGAYEAAMVSAGWQRGASAAGVLLETPDLTQFVLADAFGSGAGTTLLTIAFSTSASP